MITATSNYNTALSSFKSGRIRVFVEIAGYHRAFSNFDPTGFTWDDSAAEHNDWIPEDGIDDLQMSINDLEGGAQQIDWGFHVTDVGNAITADFATFTFEGKDIVVKTGFDGMAYADFTTVFTGHIDSVSSANNNLEYYFQCVDTTDFLTKVIYTTGDDGQPTSADHIKTVTGHPLDIMLNILGSQVGLAGSRYDSTKIEAYRDGPFSGMEMVFHLQQGVAAGEFIKTQILKPLGGYLWTDSTGKITVNFFYPIAGPTAVASLGEDTWTTIPSAEQTDMVNTVQFKFDKDDASSAAANDYLAISTQVYAPSTAKYGQYGEQEIDADGVRSGFQGFFIAALTSRLIFMRYGFKNLKFDGDAAEAIWGSVLVELGDVVSVTHSKIPDRAAGVMGVTSKLFEVLSKTINFKEGTVLYTMIDATYLQTFGFFKITSDAQADYAAATTPEKATYMFMTNDAGLYSNGDAGHGLG